MTDDAAPEPLPPPSGEPVPLPAPADEDGPTGPADRRWGRSGRPAVVEGVGRRGRRGRRGGGRPGRDRRRRWWRRRVHGRPLRPPAPGRRSRDAAAGHRPRGGPRPRLRRPGDLEELGRTQRETGHLSRSAHQPAPAPPAVQHRGVHRPHGRGARRRRVLDGDARLRGVEAARSTRGEIAGSAEGDDGVLAATDDRLAMAGGPVDDPVTLLQPVDDSLADDDDITDGRRRARRSRCLQLRPPAPRRRRRRRRSSAGRLGGGRGRRRPAC